MKKSDCMNRRKNKIGKSMKKLGEYLREQQKNKIFLTFSEIESIIGAKLPKSAKKSKWWSNTSVNRQSRSWLQNNYKVIELETIPNRHGVYFQHMTKIMDRILYNPIIKIVIIPLLIAILSGIIVTQIFDIKNKNIELKNKIKNYYFLTDIDDINLEANNIITQLENKKDYFTICKILEYQYTSLYELQINENNQNLINICLSGIEYAKKSNSQYYEILFYNRIGEVYLKQYQYSFNVADAYEAIYYLNNSDFLHGLVPCSHDIVKLDDLILELETVRTRILLSDVYYKLIENGEYTTEEYDLNYDTFKENTFFKLYQNDGRNAIKLFSINAKLEDNPNFDAYDFDKQLYLKSITNNIKCMDILHLIGQKENIDWMISSYADFNKSIDLLNEYLKIAIEENDLNNTYEITFELMRLYFFKILQGEIQYQNDFNICADYCLNTQTPSAYEIDTFFIEIKSGKLLDLYIDELENKLNEMIFSENTSYYAYLSLELAKHYYYKAVELNMESLDKEQIFNYINLSKLRCTYANYFFKNKINKRAVNELQILQSDLNALEEVLKNV